MTSPLLVLTPGAGPVSLPGAPCEWVPVILSPSATADPAAVLSVAGWGDPPYLVRDFVSRFPSLLLRGGSSLTLSGVPGSGPVAVVVVQ